MIKPKDTTAAYLAGYFDAEGSITVAKANRTNWVSVVSFGQTRSNVVLELHKIYGGNLYCFQSKKDWKPQIHYSLSRSGPVICLLTDIVPFLGEKKDQVTTTIDRFCSRMPPEEGKQLIDDLKKMKTRTLFSQDISHIATNKHNKNKSCSLKGCTRKARTRSFCSLHYQQQRTRIGWNLKYINGSAPFKYNKEPSDTDKAYIAGYFDGDGSIDVMHPKGGNWTLAIVFNQTRHEGITRIANIYGGSVKLKPPHTVTRRPQVRLYIGQRAAVLQFLQDIRPFIIEKKEEIELILNTYSPDMTQGEGLSLKSQLQVLRNAIDPYIAAQIKKTPVQIATGVSENI